MSDTGGPTGSGATGGDPGEPVPYPDTGSGGDVDGKEVDLDAGSGSGFERTTGDEPGTASSAGSIASTTVDSGEPISWTLDVKFEGKDVSRTADIMEHNTRSSSSTEREEDTTASTDAGAETSSSGIKAPEPGEDRPDTDPWGGGLEPIPLAHDAPEMTFEADSTSFVDLDEPAARLLDRGADDVDLFD